MILEGTVSATDATNCGPSSRLIREWNALLKRRNGPRDAAGNYEKLIIPAALGPGVYSASNRNEHQKQKIMFLGSKARPVRKTDNLTAICEPIV
jgi:hypothetical protein